MWLTVVAVTSLIIAGVLAVQTPQVQTYISRKVIDRMLAQYKVKVKPQIEVNSTPLLLEMLRTGHWISILPQDVVVSSPDLKAIPIKEKVEWMHICLLSLKGKRHSLLSEKFLEILRNETQNIVKHHPVEGEVGMRQWKNA